MLYKTYMFHAQIVKPSDRHCWIDFVTPVTPLYNGSTANHMCHQGSDLHHYLQLPLSPSFNHIGLIIIALKQWMLNKWSQTDRQWQHRDGIFIPFTTDRSVVPTNDLGLVSCGCIILKTRGCRKAWLYRSPMYSHCNGQTCSNTPSLPGIQYLEDDPWGC